MKKVLGWLIVIVFGILIFISVSSLITGLFGGNYKIAIIAGLSLAVLLMAKKNVVLIIKNKLVRK